MNADELDTCFKLLRAYWPSDWTEERYLVWADALAAVDADVARKAIVHMGKTTRFPTVAEFMEQAGFLKRWGGDSVISGPGSSFLPGSGTCNHYEAQPRELPAADERERVKSLIAETRRRMQPFHEEGA